MHILCHISSVNHRVVPWFTELPGDSMLPSPPRLPGRPENVLTPGKNDDVSFKNR